VAKKRKTATKPAAKKSSSGKKAVKKAVGTKKKAASKASPNELDLRPLKKQLKAHVELLSRADQGHKRVQDALASLQRVQAELNESCDPTMIIPLA